MQIVRIVQPGAVGPHHVVRNDIHAHVGDEVGHFVLNEGVSMIRPAGQQDYRPTGLERLSQRIAVGLLNVPLVVQLRTLRQAKGAADVRLGHAQPRQVRAALAVSSRSS